MKQFLSSEKGQALPIVLGLLAIGGLTIAVSLDYATTSLKGNRILEEDMKGVYAAGAGVEHALWSLKKDYSPLTQLTENINQMAANIQVEEGDTYTLYLGEMVEPGRHNDWLAVDGNIVEEDGAYKYIITVTWQPESGYEVIHLIEVGARIPPGYEYVSDSAALFPENLCTVDKVDDVDILKKTQDASEAWLLNWDFREFPPPPPPLPYVSEDEQVKTQTFYITGTGSQESHYAWVVANRRDIGAVGEITGTSYKITATAARSGDGKTTAKIVTDVMIEAGTIHILSWQISN